MDIKNMLLIAVILINAPAWSQCQPSEATKTPHYPDIIENTPTLRYIIRGGKNFYNKRIYFKDAGYHRIGYHGLNPEFNNVGLIIYHSANWFSTERFEYIGTYGNECARNKLLGSMSNWFGTGNGGLWCPEHNVIIGGTRDTNVCKKYAEHIKSQNHQR